MARERLAVYTTVYPGVEPYLADWYRSVLGQTDTDFDLWVGVDSIDHTRVSGLLGAEPGDVNFISGHGSPAQIRQRAIALLVEDYASIVFVDSDDLLYPTRVEAAREVLETYDVAGCALRIIDSTGEDLGIEFGLTSEEPLEELLPRYNVFGLSNTAYRSRVLRRCLPIAEGCQLVDWLLATRAWSLGYRLFFDRQPHMAYRQYQANVARVLLPFSAKQVLEASERVISHYHCALFSGWALEDSCRRALRQAYDSARAFNQAIKASADRLAEYVNELNRMQPRYVWWWCVAHPELEHLWKN